jgi:hypothetical protein
MFGHLVLINSLLQRGVCGWPDVVTALAVFCALETAEAVDGTSSVLV